MRNTTAKGFLASLALGAIALFGLVLLPAGSVSAHPVTTGGNDINDSVDSLVALAIIDSVTQDGFNGEEMDRKSAISGAFDDIVGLAIVGEVLEDDGISGIDRGNGHNVSDTVDDLVALAIIDSVMVTNGNGDQSAISGAFDDIVGLAIVGEVLEDDGINL